MDLTRSMYETVTNSATSVSSSVDYYWQRIKENVIVNYYYYFPPKPQNMVFMMIENSKGTPGEEIAFVTDELGNSVFIE